MQTKDALTAAKNVVRHRGCGFALIGDGCHTCRLRQRPVPFAPNISERKPTVVFSNQAKADQVRHVARQQMLRLRNTKADSAQGDFLMRTEWCFKVTLHGLPPSSCSVESLGANRRRVTAFRAAFRYLGQAPDHW